MDHMMDFPSVATSRARSQRISCDASDLLAFVETRYSPEDFESECANVEREVRNLISSARTSNRRLFGVEGVSPSSSDLARAWKEQSGTCLRCGISISTGSRAASSSEVSAMTGIQSVSKVLYLPQDSTNVCLLCRGCGALVRWCALKHSVATHTRLAANREMRDHYRREARFARELDLDAFPAQDVGLACSRYYGTDDPEAGVSRLLADAETYAACCDRIASACDELLAESAGSIQR